MSKDTQTNTDKTFKFFLEVGRYVNKEKNQDFATYVGYIGKKQEKITVKFRRDVKNVPTESGFITVKNTDMSIDNRFRYRQLWVHNFEEFTTEAEQSTEGIDNLFGDENLPF